MDTVPDEFVIALTKARDNADTLRERMRACLKLLRYALERTDPETMPGTGFVLLIDLVLNDIEATQALAQDFGRAIARLRLPDPPAEPAALRHPPPGKLH